MLIPFSPPRIDEKTIEAVSNVLRSGWITTGPKTKEFEKQLARYCNVPQVLCVNSATAGLELMLRWFGIKEGDEVIVPAYTYCATANVIVHCGATPVMVDILDDFTIDIEQVKAAITNKTKAIIPVDFAGLPCQYDKLNSLVREKNIRNLFHPNSPIQENLGRILILSDAAHSFGSILNGKTAGSFTDITVFSFHAVKNLTTAEGGAICLNLPAPFNTEDIYQYLCKYSLHGQSKDALSKMQLGNWRYDVIEAGYKCNMTDIQAAIGLIELERYKDTLQKRKIIFDHYTEHFSKHSIFEVPLYETKDRISSFHVYPLRIKGITEEQRDAIIENIFSKEVSVNVHFIPLPMLSAYKRLGFSITDYSKSYYNYSREISLPVFYALTSEQQSIVIHAVLESVKKVLGDNFTLK